MPRLKGGLITGASVLYPVLVFLGLIVFDISPRILSLLVVFMLGIHLLGSRRNEQNGGAVRMIVMIVVVGILFVAIVVTNSAYLLKLYPVLINLFLLGAFGITLFRPPSMVFRLAVLRNPHLVEKGDYAKAESYCRNVTMIWCGFFVFNTSMAVYSTFFSSDLFWTMYNGGIAYILMGTLFFGEIFFRRFVRTT